MNQSMAGDSTHNESIAGAIERVTFHNPDNGFAVLRVEAKGHRGIITVVGQMARAVAGEYIEATGVWHEDSERGRQFKAASITTAAPTSREGIEKYLGSGLVKGIGPHYARRIVAVFGEKTLAVIDESPTFLKEVKGIGPRRIQQIRESWRQQRAVRDIMLFLHSHDVGTGRAVRIYKTYGEKAIEKVKENPYRLASDIWGIGFQTADSLARKLGVGQDSPQRAQAALRHVLLELTDEGHCAATEGDAVQRASRLTGIGEDILRGAVATAIEQKELIRDGVAAAEPLLYLRHLYHAEDGVAQMLKQLMVGAHPLASAQSSFNAPAALEWVERRMGFAFADAQRQAIREACMLKVLVVTGGPGVGKTTIVRGILEIFLAKKLRCILCAPTGRAAKRLAETTVCEAKTIHRLLEFDRGGPKRDRERPLEMDLLIVDEASMVDISLMHQLLRATPAYSCIVLVGDVDQLPSVGPGMVLADIIASKAVPTVRLSEIFRQAQESGIVRAAHAVHEGRTDEVWQAGHSADGNKLGDFFFIEVEQPAVILERVVTLMRDRIPARFGLDPFQDIQVLTPMNRSELGVRNLNLRLQEVLNPPQSEGPEVARFGTTFRCGDKVLQTRNNYDRGVFNGEIGRVGAIDLDGQELTVRFDGQDVVYDFDDLDELTLAYALTIHKSQGNEYPAIVIPLHTQHFLLLQRNLLYTGLTRGKKLVVLVGSRKALGLAVERQDTQRRLTALAWRLQQ